MIQIYTTRETGSIVVWPESGSLTTSSLSMTLVDDLDLTSGSFSVYKINNPNNLSEYLVLQYYSGSGIPTASGQYTYTLFEDIDTAYKWIDANFLFGSSDAGTWGGSQSGGVSAIDSGRAFVHGTNDPTFTNYITSNEDGAYITYNN